MRNGVGQESVCMEVKASDYVMAQDTLSEKEPTGRGGIQMVQIVGGHHSLWRRVFALGDRNSGCIETLGQPEDKSTAPPTPKMSYSDEEETARNQKFNIDDNYFISLNFEKPQHRHWNFQRHVQWSATFSLVCESRPRRASRIVWQL